MCDTLQFNYLGCYGNDWVKTPNFDQLSREGILFENAYSEGLPTIPVRRAILTGRYTLPYKGWSPLELSDTTVGDILWWNSTNTAMISDTAPMHVFKFGYERGFDFVKFIRGGNDDYSFYAKDPLYHLNVDYYHKPRIEKDEEGNEVETPGSVYAKMEILSSLPDRQYWKSDEDQTVAVVVKETIEWLEKVERGRPFFLWVDSFDPHEPWFTPSVLDSSKKCPYDLDYEGKDIINPVPGYVEGLYNERELKHIRALYAEKITVVDKWIGNLLDKVRELGLEKNTMIIFTSDHGNHFGEGEHGHGIIRKSRPWPYEELVHVPLIIKAPGLEPGKRITSYVQNIDITPTMMEFLNVPEKQCLAMQGKSLMPVLKGEVNKIRDFVIAGYYNLSWSIITENCTYLHWLNNQKMDGKDDGVLASFYNFYGTGIGDQSLLKEMEKQMVETFTCVPGSETECPESDELYDRKNDPFQLNNIIEKEQEKGMQLFNQLREYITELITGENDEDSSRGWQRKNLLEEMSK